MCFPKPTQPQATPPVSDTSAANQLNLGTSSVQASSSSLLGRLGLTKPKAQASAGKPAADTTTSTPAGTLGLDPYYITHPAPPPGP